MEKSRCFSTLVCRPSRKLFFNKLKKTMNVAAAPEHDDLWNGSSRLRGPCFPETRLSLSLAKQLWFPETVRADPAEALLGGRAGRARRLRAAPRGETLLGYRMSGFLNQVKQASD